MPNDKPGANDQEIVNCVCEIDAFCCDTKWDELCAGKVESCGGDCNCTSLPDEVLGCTNDKDCGFCGGDACDGTWMCIDGKCGGGEPVVCDDSLSKGCVTNTCNPFSGECELEGDDSGCDDKTTCTADECNLETGECTNDAIEGCGMNHPCKGALVPGSSDAAITECVCAEDSYCCNNKWDNTCVNVAQESCGLVCDCATLPAEITTCEEDDDCGFCDPDDDVCNGGWKCTEGKCAATEPVVCDTSGDNGCVKTTCSPFSGECNKDTDNASCDDDTICTSDSCDAETGECLNEPIEDCDPSCADKCNSDYVDDAVCQCDPDCFEYGDCCEDICTECSTEYETSCAEGGSDEGGDTGDSPPE